MQTSIAQIVALTLYGNQFLRSPSEFLSPAFLSNSTFQFCESVTFADMASTTGDLSRKGTPYAANPVEWFEYLRKEGVRSLHMRYEPSHGTAGVADRMLVGFVGGGGRWLIEARGEERTGYWESRWQLGDRKTWSVLYGRIFQGKPLAPDPTQDLVQLEEELRRCLEEIARFSHSQNLTDFTKCFEDGLKKLDSPTPLVGGHLDDIAPAGFVSLQGLQLLGAAEAAWVFGGMGSWNDTWIVGRAPKAEYEKVSEHLYRLLNRVIVAVANSKSIP